MLTVTGSRERRESADVPSRRPTDQRPKISPLTESPDADPSPSDAAGHSERPPAAVATGAAAATTSTAVVGDTAWVAFAKITPQVSALVLSVFAANALGPDGLGAQSFIAFVEISLISLIVEGFSTSISRYVARVIGAGDASLVAPLYAWARKVALGLAVVCGAVMFTIALARPELRTAWIVSGVSAIVNCLNRIPSSVLIGMQRWRRLSRIDVGFQTLGTIAAIILLQLGYGIVGIFAATAASSAVNLVVFSVMARSAIPSLGRSVRLVPDPLRREVVRYAIMLGGAMVITLIVWRRSEFFFLDHYVADGEIAQYSIAFAAVAALTQLPWALSFVAMPAVATLDGARSDERIRGGVSRALRLAGGLALPVTAAAFAGGPVLIEGVFSEKFHEAGVILRIMVLSFPPICLVLVAMGILAGLGRQRFPLVIGTIGAALNLLLALALIPTFAARGAAVSSLTAQLVTGLPILLYLSTILGPIAWGWRRQANMLAASIVGYLAMYATMRAIPGGLGLGPGVLAGLAGLLLTAQVLPIVAAEDARWALGLTRGRGERLIARIGGLGARG
jgi:O-antigen/teichoic acid export membrane protein